MSGIFGGGDSESSSATTDNRMALESGATGINFNGSSKSTLNYSPSIVMSDSGAMALTHDVMEGVGAYAAEAARLQQSTNIALLDTADSMLANTLSAHVDVTNGALNTSLDSIRLSLEASAASAADAVASANASANRTAEVSTAAMDNVSLIADRSQGLAWESAAEALGLTRNVISAAFDNTADVNAMSLATVRNVADAYQSARETEVTAQFQDYRYILIAGLIVVGIVAFKAVK